MADRMRLCVFGDQTCDLKPLWKDAFKARNNPAVEDFMGKAFHAVRQEIYNLPRKDRAGIPRFNTVNDLLLSTQAGRQHVAVDTAISCIYQLATFMSRADSWYHEEGEIITIGLCLGGLAAAAASCSRSTLDLIPRAVDAVRAAFRTGMHAVETSKRLVTGEFQPDGEATWAMLFNSPTASQALAQYCDRNALPLTSRPYISAFTAGTATVSGPPDALKRLASSEEFESIKSRKIPVYGPFHAEHLYTDDDVNEVMQDLASDSANERKKYITFLSSTGATIEGPDFHSLLKSAVGAILAHPMRFPALLEQLEVYVQSRGPSTLDIWPIATTADRLIFNTFKQTEMGALISAPTPPTTSQKKIGTSQPSPQNPKTAKLAIVGMSGRFPGGANSTEAFWDLLYQGLDVHKAAPLDRWDVGTHVDLTGKRKNTGAVPWGCWIEDSGLFDAHFFNISPREAPQIDPAQRMAIMTVYEAVERAGLVVNSTPSTRSDRVGVFYGVTGNDWAETNASQDIDTYLIPGGNRAFIPGRINYFYKFSGASAAIDTACSSALSAIHVACNSLWRGDIDTAVAGGTNFMSNPDFHAGLDRGHFLSKTGNCKTFDDTADGYCRGEGVGTVIIKRLSDAIAENDPILGVILDIYTNHSSESESITRPYAKAQCAAFGKILNQANVDPYSLSYIEMHGTGTQVGDATEMSSVLSTFAPPLTDGPRERSDREALYLGSAKANIGHGEASSGSSSLIKVLLMMQHDTIVPHCGIKGKINHRFPTDLEQRKVNIASKPVPWPRSNDPFAPRRVLVNNFSAAGGNTALLLEDAPIGTSAPIPFTDPRSMHVVAVSAKTGVSLQGNLRSLRRFIEQNQDVPLGQLSYTTTARRMHHPHRAMLSGGNLDEIRTQIDAALQANTGLARPKSGPKIVFSFTGQGAQFPGMGKQLLQHVTFRKEMTRLNQLCRSLGFPSALSVIEAEDDQNINEFEPAAVQLASVCLQIALRKLWATWNITPLAVVGHSLGEYAALNAAGVLSDADTLYLVGKRSQHLQQRCTRETHSMLVVRASVDDISDVIEEKIPEIGFACINSPVETVLAGPNGAISATSSLLEKAGKKTTLLRVPFAFHSAQLDCILSDLRETAQGVTFSRPSIPILCPLDGSIVESEGTFGPEYLARHSREPVNMLKALMAGKNTGAITEGTTILEIGPHPAMAGMVRAVLGSQMQSLASMQRGRTVWQMLCHSVKHLYTAGAEICWPEWHAGFEASHQVLPLPSYSWNLKEYWIPYVHDWSLRKGDPPLVITGSRLESTTIHNVIEETEGTDGVNMIVEADIQRDDLKPVVQGHEVDGLPLCTPSVYADIALSVGKHILHRYREGEQNLLVDITDMTIGKALILRSSATRQPLQAHMQEHRGSNSAVVKFMSFDNKQKLQQHSQARIVFKNRSLREHLQKDVRDVKLKLQRLRDGIVSGATARYNRAMCYRAIRPLARFHADYQAADEVLLDSKTLECSSILSFATVKRGGNFDTHPAMIDALTQSCGFAMNCSDTADLDQDVYMNHGWGSLQLFEPIDSTKRYTTYTRMHEGAEKLWHGDVVVMDQNDTVVAFFGQVAIQCVPRRVLKVILSIEGGASTQKQATAPVQKSKPDVTPAQASNEQTPSTQQTPPATTHLAKKERRGQVPVMTPDVSLWTKALGIIGEESGLSKADLTDNTAFSDAGIDSLLGLTISSRFKSELDLDMDFNALLFEHETLGELKKVFAAETSDSGTSAGATTPDSSEADLSASSFESAPSTHGDAKQGQFVQGLDFGRALKIISEESGVAASDLTDDTVFADAGVDSLLGLTIVSRFRDELDLEVERESLFLDCDTVGDMKATLLGSIVSDAAPPDNEKQNEKNGPPNRAQQAVASALAARKKAVDELVNKYTVGYSGPATPPSTASAPINNEKVVVVTGATGSLGCHLAYQIVQKSDVKTVVCLNRRHRQDPYKRQIKAMRDKGIRFPDALRPKLAVLQTDTSGAQLGLPHDEYQRLVSSATHLIHNAWPMSAKRELEGFEPQFEVMQNLIHFATEATSQRPSSFKFSLEMVSSIGVVGLFGKGNGEETVHAPEERLGIDCILNNGYGDAKWGCERMLDETLHKHPDRFRTMATRLGQIAGSKTSGYWNPMEHFGFLIKSSQTLKALPDMPGRVYWTPVNDVADAVADVLLSDHAPYRFYHVENPVGQPWSEMTAILADTLGITSVIPFPEWVERVRNAPQKDNPASNLIEFLDDDYTRMSCGGLVLDTKHTLEHSKSLNAVGPVSEEVIRKYIHIWKEIGFLSK